MSSINRDCFRLFALNNSRKFGQEIADYLKVSLAKHVEYGFDDNEPYIRSDENVRSCDCFVVSSIFDEPKESVCEKIIKLMFFVGSLWDASARRITVVAPYLGFARQDRKTESRAGIYTKYIAEMFESVRANRLMTMDIHNPGSIQNAYRSMQTDNLEAKNIIADYISGLITSPEKVTVLSPDSGGMKRAERFRDALSSRIGYDLPVVAHIDKRRAGRTVTAQSIGCNVQDKEVILVDDLISTGNSLRVAEEIIAAAGGKLWVACATHGVFVGPNANDNLAHIAKIVVADTIPLWSLNDDSKKKVHVVSTAKIFAEAIRLTHMETGSISALLG